MKKQVIADRYTYIKVPRTIMLFLAVVTICSAHLSAYKFTAAIEITYFCFLFQKKIEENKQKLSTFTQHTYNLSQTRRNNTVNSTDIDVNLLTRRQDDALCTLNSLELSAGEKDSTSCQEESSYTSSVVLLGGNVGGKNAIRPIKLLEVAKLPPYTTWIFLDR